jgi:hypothetical protein
MEFVLWLKEENESPDVGLIGSIGFGGDMKTDGHIVAFLIQRYHFLRNRVFVSIPLVSF